MKHHSRRLSMSLIVLGLLPIVALTVLIPRSQPDLDTAGSALAPGTSRTGLAHAAPSGPSGSAGLDQAAPDPMTAPLPHFRPSDDASSMVWQIAVHFGDRRSMRADPAEVKVGKPSVYRTAPKQLELEMFNRAGAKIRSINAWHPMRYEASAVERPTAPGPRLAAAASTPGPAGSHRSPSPDEADGPDAPDAEPPTDRRYDMYHVIQPKGEGTLFVPFDPQVSSIRVIDWTQGGYELGRISLEGAARRYCVTDPSSEFCQQRVQLSTLYFAPFSTTVGAGELFTLELRARKVADFYGGQLAVLFNPSIVQVVDQDPGRPGAQIRPGDFPKPDEVLRNVASNATGRLEYYFTLTGEKTGPNGSGVVAYIVLRGNVPGHTFLTITETVLSDSQSLRIPAKSEVGLVVVEDAPSVQVSGQVELERRPTSAGATVCSPSECVLTDAAGNYSLRALAGRPLAVGHPSYLRAARMIPAAATGSVTLPKVKLLSGDFDKDDRVEIVDAAMIGQRFNVRYNGTAPDPRWLKACDITDDNVINILDMVGVQFNMLKTAPVPWPGAMAARVLGGTAQVASSRRVRAGAFDLGAGALDWPPRTWFGSHSRPLRAPVKVRLSPTRRDLEAPKGEATFDVMVDDVENLFAYRLQLRFDPKRLSVKDVSPDETGTQVAIGEFLDPLNSFVLLNQADNSTGVVDVGLTQTAPAAGKAGSGVLATITFKGRSAGEAEVQLAEAVLVDDTLPIPVTLPTERSGASITVTGGQPIIYLPSLSQRDRR